MANTISSPTVPDAAARRRALSGYLLLVLALLMWSGNSVVGRAAAAEAVPPMALNFWRWVTAFVLFAAFFGRATWHQRAEILAHWKFVAGFSMISIVGFNAALYMALQRTTALQASLIQSILPALVLLLGLVILRERITARQWWGVVFSIAGAALIVVRGDISVIGKLTLNSGDLWALAAVFLWGWQAFLMRWKPKTIGIMPLMTSMTLIGIVAMAPLYALETAVYAPMPVTRASVIFILYVGVMAGFVGTTCWNEGTYRTGGAQAGYFGNLYPIFAGVLAIAILGEQPHWYHFAGAASVVAGIWLATAQRARR